MLFRSHLQRFAALALAFLLSIAAALAQENCLPDASPPAVQAALAVSLRRLETELRACQPQDACSEQTLTWYGMTRVGGYVIDPVRQDIIVYGSADPGLPPLRVEDFVVSLRNALHRYVMRDGDSDRLLYSDPAVSIDPDPRVMRELDRVMAGVNGSHAPAARDHALQAWCSVCALPQAVRVEGVPTDNHFSYVMVSADYLMKRLVDGSVRADGLDSLADAKLSLAIRQSRGGRRGSAGTAGMNRFWFYPSRNLYLEDKTAVQLVRSDVILLNEAEQVTRDGRIAASGRADPLAHTFACAFSRSFPALAAAGSPYPVYAELSALFRWSAISRILSSGAAFEAAGYMPDFMINEFTVPTVAVPRTLSGIAAVKAWDDTQSDGHTRRQISLILPSCGGVSMSLNDTTMHVTPDTAGELPKVREAVVGSRPAPLTTSWLVLRR